MARVYSPRFTHPNGDAPTGPRRGRLQHSSIRPRRRRASMFARMSLAYRLGVLRLADTGDLFRVRHDASNPQFQ